MKKSIFDSLVLDFDVKGKQDIEWQAAQGVSWTQEWFG